MGLRGVGSITFGGLSSGLKTDEIIAKLLEVERGPIDALKTRRDDFGARLDIFRDLNTKTLRLRDALRALDNRNLVGTGASADEEFLRFSARSSDERYATATTDGVTSAASLRVRVVGLAQASRFVSDQSFSSL